MKNSFGLKRIFSYILLLITLTAIGYAIFYIPKVLDIFLKYNNYFITGVVYTVGLSLISVIIGSILGSFIALAKISEDKILKTIATAYVEIIRGTPLITQLFIVFFGSSVLFNVRELKIPISTLAFISGVIAVSLNSAAYVAEIVRAGIESIDKGQTEAGRSLGMSKAMTMKEIIMPQAIKNILPSLGNEFIAIIKETSIISVIGVGDIMYNVNIVRSTSYKSIEPLFIAAIMYFVLTFTLSKLVNMLEGKLKESD